MKPRVAISLLFLFLLLTACAASPPLTLSEIPIFPEAEVVARGQNEAADRFAQAMEQALSGTTLQSSVALYRIPVASSWEEVRAFYESELAKGDWRVGVTPSGNGAMGGSGAGWSRGSFNQEQGLLLTLTSDPDSGESFLFVGLFSE